MAITPFQLFLSPPLLKPTLKPLPYLTPLFAGRSKKPKHTGGRIEGPGEVRREAKERARHRSRRMSENRFYRRKKQASNHADSFTEEELEMIGLGYDRYVRFMSGPDDPLLRHPHDWYKYGEFGPFSWRGIVVGPPVRGRFSDKSVTLISQVNSHEEWDEINQFEMSKQYAQRLDKMDPNLGVKHYWAFVRHPKWRPSDLPWQQWTLVAEVAVEADEKERIDKWTLMNRIGNHTREMITQCAAWQRPDIIYVKKPIYQIRFEPQVDFFRPLGPLLDPATESNFQFLASPDSPPVSYFLGLCKILKANPKWYVDDVVKCFEKLDEEGKSKCLEFLLGNHPWEVLHPFTKEWKVKLEEEELGCDAPDEEDEELEGEMMEWSEDEEEREEEEEEKEEEREEGEEEEEEREEYWEENFEKALKSSEMMEKLVEKSVKRSTEYYKRQMEEEKREEERVKVSEMEEREREWREREWRERRRERKEKMPPGMFLKAAVRPYTYRSFVKDIVLMRHAILEGDVSPKSWS